ncbi:hypothetical protein cypCar_00047586 [Cyprinus carpio]|nr:hypothetical protein cypCar_00047586 [Cyprinus carpio]
MEVVLKLSVCPVSTMEVVPLPLALPELEVANWTMRRQTSGVREDHQLKTDERDGGGNRKTCHSLIPEMFEDIVKMNDHLECAEAAQCFTMKQQITERLSEAVKLNLVVCGSDGMLKSSVSEQILQQTDRRSDVELHDRQISVIELPALARLSEEEVMRQTLSCVSLCHPGVHAFLLIIPDAPLNHEDKADTEKIQRIFSSRINKHIMILIKQDSEHQTEGLSEETQSVIERFGGRHHFFGPKTQVSTLMENIEQMLEGNRGEFYSTETFLEAQMKTLMKYDEIKKKINSIDTYLLSQGNEQKISLSMKKKVLTDFF